MMSQNLHFELGNASDIQRFGRSFDASRCSDVLEYAYQNPYQSCQITRFKERASILIVTVPYRYGPFEVSNNITLS
jgi:hypothetical protein